MDMESTAEFSSSDHSAVVVTKRKRSNRQRRSSPFCATAAITSSYSSGGGGGGVGGGGSGSNCFPIDQCSPSISTDLSPQEEDELVDCLMLLAKGICPNNELRKSGHRNTEKFSSRKVVEIGTSIDIAAAADENGKDGYVVYECKTCYRTFPSFQALGGHCASHKKPKLTPGENTERSLALLPPLINADEEGETRIDTKHILSPLPLQMISGGKVKAKMHECSICHTDFSSGQALGGHMRRHRTPIIKPPPPLPPATNPSSPRSQFIPNIDSTKVDAVENRCNMLTFDLNLPAAPEDDHPDFNSASASTSRGIICLPIFE